MSGDCCAERLSAPWCDVCYRDLCPCEQSAGHECGGMVAFTDGEARVTARWRDEQRVVVELWRSAARGWVGTGAVCGTRWQVLGWLADERHWPDAAPFLPRLRGWLERTGPGGVHVP